MRVLWIKMGGLWPVDTGGRRRTFQTLEELSRRHEVVVVTTHPPHEDGSALARHLPGCREVRSQPHDVPKHGSARFLGALARSWLSRYPVDLWKWRLPAVRREVAHLTAHGDFDVVVADFLFAAVNAPWRSRVPIVYFAHNVEYLIWKRLCDVEPRWWRRLALALEWRKVRRCEIRTCRRAAVTIAVSDGDRQRLAEDAPGARVVATPTGVDTTFFAPDEGAERPNHLVFSGSMDWYPNEDAVLHFVDAIFPAIRHRIPEVTFSIVGRNPGARVRALASIPGVRVSGTVDDVRPLIAEGAVCVVPLRVGGGTRLKIFEALAMGKPVLSTTLGAEGLDLEPGRHLAIADDPAMFSEAAVALLGDAARRRAMAREGRRLVEARYAWARVVDDFETHLQEAANRHAVPDERSERRVLVS
jgi:glycosyltransferase involved in cell wall biosynthesis